MVSTSGVATGVQGGQSAPLTAKNLPKIRRKRKKSGEIGKKEEKSGRKGKNREGSFTLPLLTDRAGNRVIQISRLFKIRGLISFFTFFRRDYWPLYKVLLGVFWTTIDMPVENLIFSLMSLSTCTRVSFVKCCGKSDAHASFWFSR